VRAGALVHTHTRKMGEIALVVLPKGAKTCFVFCVFSAIIIIIIIIIRFVKRQNVKRLPWLPSATYPTLISTNFEIKDVNQFPHTYTDEKLPNFCSGGYPCPKKAAEMGTVDGGVCLHTVQLKWHNFG